MEKLWEPIQIGRITLPHRVVFSPMTRLRNTDDHVPTELGVEHYAQRASCPGTLLISEATLISERAGGLPNTPGVYNKEQVGAWRKIIDAVHAKGSFFFLQLWAVGRSASPAVLKPKGHEYVGAGDIPPDGIGEAPRPLTKQEIKEYIQDFAQCAKNAIEAGSDGVNLHLANGYLPHQFLASCTNNRTDEYGGSIENRARFLLEIIDAVNAAVGADRNSVRFSPWSPYGDMTYDTSPIPEYAYLLTELEKRGLAGDRLAYVDFIEPRVDGNFTLHKFNGTNSFVKDIWTGVWLRNGALCHDYNVLSQCLNEYDKTVPNFGRFFIANPDLPDRLKNQIELNKYDRPTFYTGGKQGYNDYPFAKE